MPSEAFRIPLAGLTRFASSCWLQSPCCLRPKLKVSGTAHAFLSSNLLVDAQLTHRKKRMHANPTFGSICDAGSISSLREPQSTRFVLEHSAIRFDLHRRLCLGPLFFDFLWGSRVQTSNRNPNLYPEISTFWLVSRYVFGVHWLRISGNEAYFVPHITAM